MKKIIGWLMLISVGCSLTGCAKTGVLLKNGNRIDDPKAKVFLGDKYVRARAVGSATKIEKDAWTAANPDAAGINSCRMNARVLVSEDIMNRVMAGVVDSALKVQGKQITLDEVRIDVKKVLPVLSPNTIYEVMGDNCYSNMNKKFASEIENQAACSCELYGAISIDDLTKSLQNVYGPGVVSGVKSYLVAHGQ